MLWSWYLADDTQFYIIGAIILIVAVRLVNLVHKFKEYYHNASISFPNFSSRLTVTSK